MQLYWELISQSTISLAFLLGWILSLILFADCTTFAKRCALGLTVSAIHCIAAFSVLILLECLTDAAIDRGAVGREGEYSLYTYFLSHLPDLSHLVEYDIFNITKLYAIWMKHSMTVFDGMLSLYFHLKNCSYLPLFSVSSRSCCFKSY
jgi:hypothetical protein